MYNPIKEHDLNSMLSEVCRKISKNVTSESELFREISEIGNMNNDLSSYIEYDYVNYEHKLFFEENN